MGSSPINFSKFQLLKSYLAIFQRFCPRFGLLATFIIFLRKNGPIHFAYFLIKYSLEPYKQYKKSPLANCLHFGS